MDTSLSAKEQAMRALRNGLGGMLAVVLVVLLLGFCLYCNISRPIIERSVSTGVEKAFNPFSGEEVPLDEVKGQSCVVVYVK